MSRVSIFHATSLVEVTSLPLKGHQPYCCAFSPDGLLLAAGGGGTDMGGGGSKSNCVVRVRDAASGTMIAELAGHTGLVRDLAFWPNAKRLLSAGWDGTVRVRDLSPATRPK